MSKKVSPRKLAQIQRQQDRAVNALITAKDFSISLLDDGYFDSEMPSNRDDIYWNHLRQRLNKLFAAAERMSKPTVNLINIYIVEILDLINVIQIETGNFVTRSTLKEIILGYSGERTDITRHAGLS